MSENVFEALLYGVPGLTGFVVGVMRLKWWIAPVVGAVFGYALGIAFGESVQPSGEEGFRDSTFAVIGVVWALVGYAFGWAVDRACRALVARRPEPDSSE